MNYVIDVDGVWGCWGMERSVDSIEEGGSFEEAGEAGLSC